MLNFSENFLNKIVTVMFDWIIKFESGFKALIIGFINTILPHSTKVLQWASTPLFTRS